SADTTTTTTAAMSLPPMLMEHAVLRIDSLGPAHRLVAAVARRGGDQHANRLVPVVRDRAPALDVEAGERSFRQRVLVAVDHHRGVAAECEEDLFLVAAGLVVLG